MHPVKANKVAGFNECKNPGDYFFSPVYEENTRKLDFICPCGCGQLCGIKVANDGYQRTGIWGWNKDENKPTCTPSIRINQDHWHGHLKDGVFSPI